ncbi:cache domain-containing sensor histidine kinase [Gracilibacillus halophilus]|nr:histidine kinase [Gracilibacillus halophilus]
MVILTSLVLLAFSIGGLSALYYAYQLYNQEIYRQSAQSIQVSSNSIDAELKKMESLSYQVATDAYVQSYLKQLQHINNGYKQYITGMELRNRLLQIGALNKYVSSIHVYDGNMREYASGNHTINLLPSRLETIQTMTNEQGGGISWVPPSNEDTSLIAAREVRDYLDFSLEKLGFIVIRIHIDDIIHDLTHNLAKEDTTFMIYNNQQKQMFINDPQKNRIIGTDLHMNEKGYQMIKNAGERYFVTYSEASFLEWTYMIVTPYSNLFTVITQARTAVVVTYFGLFLFMIYLGSKFTGTIVDPIESLNRKMQNVQIGDMDNYNKGVNEKYPTDEAGEMHRNFNKMMQHINDLIDENYKKQLIMKESEFQTLQAQVNPHFLYNTLESMNWSAKIAGQQRISQMAESLGYVLRASINMKETYISLKEEVAIVDHYINIQRYRFEERLQFQKLIPSHLLVSTVPKFIIQPIIENAIRYGLQEMIEPCMICLQVKETQERIQIMVSDNGPGIDPNIRSQLATGTFRSKGTGIGLRNIHERLNMLYGPPFGIDIVNGKHRGVTVTITLPIERRDEGVQSAVSR